MPCFAKRLVVLAVCGMVAGMAACRGSSLPTPHDYRLGDDRFAVTVRAFLEGWVERVGSRFDTTAAVISVRRDGREFLCAEGLADEFNPKWIAPPGYNDARPGEPFLKVGIGNLLRTHDRRYLFGPHPVQSFAPDRVLHVNAAEAVFRQEFDSGLGWAYAYEKSYSVEAAEGRLSICYRLRNTGGKPLDIEQYNHNWIRLSDRPPGVGYSLESPFKLDPSEPTSLKLKAEGGKIDLLEAVLAPAYTTAEQAVPSERNRLVIRNAQSGLGVEISGDFAVSRFALFADEQGVCPEIFGHWIIAPGQAVTWRRTYRFFAE